ncbi:hypothetical protein BDW59DRAFT_144625 [Aspergillus cavernicola]|uniref:Uncharacterized protein n=1 Tax=Aspergillus cavernicola TaxID=176166 RepID=A0ABR4IH49_9EURO
MILNIRGFKRHLCCKDDNKSTVFFAWECYYLTCRCPRLHVSSRLSAWTVILRVFQLVSLRSVPSNGRVDSRHFWTHHTSCQQIIPKIRLSSVTITLQDGHEQSHLPKNVVRSHGCMTGHPVLCTTFHSLNRPFQVSTVSRRLLTILGNPIIRSFGFFN